VSDAQTLLAAAAATPILLEEDTPTERAASMLRPHLLRYEQLGKGALDAIGGVLKCARPKLRSPQCHGPRQQSAFTKRRDESWATPKTAKRSLRILFAPPA
jgi:hypothetical protein